MTRPPELVVRAARDRLQGLVGARDSPAPSTPSGWTPSAPVVEVARMPDPGRADPRPAAGPLPDAGDVRDVVARMRAGALENAATVYTAAYGHPLEHPSPDAPGGPRRWQLSVRLAVVAAIAVVVLGAGVVARATLTAPAVPVVDAPAPDAAVVATPEPAGSPAVDGPTAGPASGRSASADVVVHVVGQVAAPGVVRLPPGSRVIDAVQAAGGAGPGADLAGLNLARVVQDGEQIVVPLPGEVVAGAGAPAGGAPGGVGGGRAGGGADAPVDLNAADLPALDALPGIGPVLAQRIVDWRTEHGRFTTVEELGEVAGIGETLLGRLRELVRV
ncbi:MAG: ComEA family DNA-binding protein [Cellulomonas sp.]